MTSVEICMAFIELSEKFCWMWIFEHSCKPNHNKCSGITNKNVIEFVFNPDDSFKKADTGMKMILLFYSITVVRYVG